jgi:predicted nucleotidyltransferase component of viral defense system
LLSNAELADVAALFGVAEEQVRRDHLISHLLNAPASLDLPLTFFGGTALARTHLTEPSTGGRMSEDIDLHTPERTRGGARDDHGRLRLCPWMGVEARRLGMFRRSHGHVSHFLHL